MRKPTKEFFGVCHLALAYRPYYSGAGVYLEKKLFPQFSERGIKNLVVTANYGDAPAYEHSHGVEVHRVRISTRARRRELGFTLAALLPLFRLRDHYQLIQLNGLWDRFGVITLFAWLFGKRLVLRMTMLGSDDPVSVLQRYRFIKWRKPILTRVHRFIALSTPMASAYSKARFPQEKLVQIPNGIDTQLYRPATSGDEKQTLREKFGLPARVPVVVTVCAIVPRKGIHTLVGAWKVVQSRAPDALLLLVGPYAFDDIYLNSTDLAEYHGKLEDAIQEHHLNVRFFGPSDDVAGLLRAADVFVLASEAEGFPNVVVEAMASGLPVVVSDMQGIAQDIVEPGHQGYIFSGVSELGGYISSLLLDRETRDLMGEAARQAAEKHFDIRHISCRYIDVYRDALDA